MIVLLYITIIIMFFIQLFRICHFMVLFNLHHGVRRHAFFLGLQLKLCDSWESLHSVFGGYTARSDHPQWQYPNTLNIGT